jgi:hypothetical protein
LTLLGDKYMHPSLVDIAVPFASGYRTFWTSLGIIGGWGLALLGLSFYVRRHIGAARWRKLHRLTAVMWLAGLAHALGEGTDAGQIWFLAMMAIVVIPALLLLATRWLGANPGPRPASQPRDRELLDVRGVRVGTVPIAPGGRDQSPPPTALAARASHSQRKSGRSGHFFSESRRAGGSIAARPPETADSEA